MSNYEKLKEMTIEEMAAYLYLYLSKKGQAKTLEWLRAEHIAKVGKTIGSEK